MQDTYALLFNYISETYWIPLTIIIFFKRLIKNLCGTSQQGYKNMLNITNHYGNANQNYNEISPLIH